MDASPGPMLGEIDEPDIGSAFFDLAPELFCVVAPGAIFTRVNAAWETQLGWTRAELEGTSAREITHPDDYADGQAIRATLDSVGVARGAGRLRAKSGEWRRMEWTAFKGARGLTTLCFRDVTAAHEAQRSAGRRAGQLARAVKMAGLIVWEHDLRTDAVEVIGDSEATLGFDLAAHLRAGTLMETVHPLDRARVEAELKSANRARTPYSSEFRIVSGKGEAIWIQSSTEGAFDAAGHPVKLAGVFRDVTALRALHRQHALLAQAIDHTEAGVAIAADADGYPVVYVNSGYERLTGYAAQDLIGRGSGFLAGPDTDPAAMRAIRTAAAAGDAASVDMISHRKDGAPFWNACRITPFVDPATGERFFVSVENDITARVEAERREIEAREAAEAANRAKTAFLANLGHEIRTPLNGLLGLLQVAQQTRLTPEQRSLLASALASGETLTGLLNDLLDIARIEAGAMAVEAAPTPLEPLTRQIVEAFAPLAGRKGLTLRLELDGPAPAALGDAKRIRQILFNLISNAIKFTPAGEILVIVGVDAVAGQARLRVMDQGPGIAPDQAHLLFQRFTQVDASSTRAAGGLGLGLAISRDLAHLMGGDIGHQPAPGGGACFWVTLPLAADPLLEVEPVAHDPIPLAERHVLVVEDQPTNQRVARALLEALGASVVVAANGALGVEAAAAEPFDLIFMDIQMPVMDGLEATRTIRAGHGPNAQTPILALTANVMPQHIDSYRAAGLAEIISKPVQLADLIAKSRLALSAAPEPADRVRGAA